MHAYLINRCDITKLQSFSKRVSVFCNRGNAHKDEPGHPLIGHTFGQVVCHQDIQQKLQQRVEHVEHAEEVEERDGNAEDMFEPDGRHADEYASERVGDEQTGDEL